MISSYQLQSYSGCGSFVNSQIATRDLVSRPIVWHLLGSGCDMAVFYPSHSRPLFIYG